MANEGKSGVESNFRPAVTKRASEIIYDQIRDLINRRELKPGDRLPSERSMMEMFQRSRPTIREALRMLERTGYIRTIAGSNGAIVMEPSDENVEQVMEDALCGDHISLNEMSEYRHVCEVATAGWAAERCTEEDLTALQKLLDQMKSLLDDHEACIGLDPQFHKLLAIAAKNQVAAMMNKTFSQLNQSFMKEKMGRMTPTGRKRMSKRVYEQHQAIYNALAAHDPAAARTAMATHLDSFAEDLR
jgi:GntR family transcriptional repressor for pyruvate dehydrogenase complex